MADKKLDDLMKDLQTYTVQVAQEKKKAQAEAYRPHFVFPWKYLFLAVAICVWYFWKPLVAMKTQIAKQPHVMKILEVLDQSGPEILPAKVSVVKARQDALNGVESPTLQNQATAPEVTRKPSSSDIVQIEGRWYKKSPDNIYYINGRRVFFIDNRKREEPPK